MLPFGSLTTNIPLIAFAFAYLLYFGMYALNRNKAEDTACVAISNDKVLEVTPATSKIPANCFNYADYNHTDSFIAVEDISLPHPVIIPVITLFHKKKIPVHYGGFAFSTRPPPFNV